MPSLVFTSTGTILRKNHYVNFAEYPTTDTSSSCIVPNLLLNPAKLPDSDCCPCGVNTRPPVINLPPCLYNRNDQQSSVLNQGQSPNVISNDTVPPNINICQCQSTCNSAITNPPFILCLNCLRPINNVSDNKQMEVNSSPNKNNEEKGETNVTTDKNNENIAETNVTTDNNNIDDKPENKIDTYMAVNEKNNYKPKQETNLDGSKIVKPTIVPSYHATELHSQSIQTSDYKVHQLNASVWTDSPTRLHSATNTIVVPTQSKYISTEDNDNHTQISTGTSTMDECNHTKISRSCETECNEPIQKCSVCIETEKRQCRSTGTNMLNDILDTDNICIRHSCQKLSDSSQLEDVINRMVQSCFYELSKRISEQNCEQMNSYLIPTKLNDSVVKDKYEKCSLSTSGETISENVPKKSCLKYKYNEEVECTPSPSCECTPPPKFKFIPPSTFQCTPPPSCPTGCPPPICPPRCPTISKCMVAKKGCKNPKKACIQDILCPPALSFQAFPVCMIPQTQCRKPNYTSCNIDVDCPLPLNQPSVNQTCQQTRSCKERKSKFVQEMGCTLPSKCSSSPGCKPSKNACNQNEGCVPPSSCRINSGCNIPNYSCNQDEGCTPPSTCSSTPNCGEQRSKCNGAGGEGCTCSSSCSSASDCKERKPKCVPDEGCKQILTCSPSPGCKVPKYTCIQDVDCTPQTACQNMGECPIDNAKCKKRKSKSCKPIECSNCCKFPMSYAKYAMVRISDYESYRTYEIMKSSCKPPKLLSNQTQDVFVIKKESCSDKKNSLFNFI